MTDNTVTKWQTYDLQNFTQKAKDRATRTPLKPCLKTSAPEELAVPAPVVAPVMQINATW
jgi:hypothetical protein